MNSTVECYISDEDVELAQTIATYLAVGVFTLCTCVIGRCLCGKSLCC